jgi:hypothetical protein
MKIIFKSLLVFLAPAAVQAKPATLDTTSRWIADSVRITIDRPQKHAGKAGIVILYALPNGNTTEQTFGKSIAAGEDARYNIQNIGAQTEFIRKELRKEPVTVIYLENNLRSWPAWKRKHPGATGKIRHLVDSLYQSFPMGSRLYLNGHSGGGSFIFGYLASVTGIPSYVHRISFLDSNYGYDSTYFPKLTQWLKANSQACLNIFAYNDSVALYQGKRFVSDTGGTWYRSHLMLKHFSRLFEFRKNGNDTLQLFSAMDGRLRFYLLDNFDQGIYHTKQVEFNGFIHSILCGTVYEEKKYRYYGPRAY